MIQPEQNTTALDKEYVWHPFTNLDTWLANDFEPIVITHGKGSWLYDDKGRSYLDGNSSIWTNI
ncbi:MAG: adenosylmethionine--8-amino-7-oxononanoate transaminase, partial [Verrucomicrobiota bacterium]